MLKISPGRCVKIRFVCVMMTLVLDNRDWFKARIESVASSKLTWLNEEDN
jgi:hypothetical protein